MKRKQVLLCWSGGKDSSMTLYELKRRNEYDVAALLTTVTRDYDRISMHGVRRSLLVRQAESLGIPLCEVPISRGASNLEYEASMAEALNGFLERGIVTVAFGDIFLEDLREYRIRQLAGIGMQALFPIWKRDTSELVETFIDLGFKAYTSCVDPRALDNRFVGRLIDRQFVQDLPAGVDPCGENGEFHSFVSAGPIFQQEIPIAAGDTVLRDGFLFCDLLPVDNIPIAGRTA